MTNKNIVIGIEGLVGAGKTSICINLLEKIPNSIVLHAGNIYRAIVYAILNSGVKLEELENIMLNVDIKDIIDRFNIEVKVNNRQTCVYVNGNLIDEKELQSEKNSMAVSIVSNKANNKKAFEVVKNLVEDLKQKYNVIFSGRALMEIYPKLDYHIFITADLDERVNRKYNQYKGEISKEELKNHISKRDELQELSGFYKKYENTIIIDVTKCKSVEESTKKVLDSIKNKIKNIKST